MSSARKALIAVTTGLMSVSLAAVLLPTSAEAATPRPYGRIAATLQHRDGSVAVTGWIFDRSNPNASVTACLAVNAACVRTVSANRPSPHFNAYHHITGRHAFYAHVSRQRPGVQIELRGSLGSSSIKLWSVHVLTPGQRVVDIAKQFVGRVAYTWGGASPSSGFDCSGYALYAYKHAKVASLPHNSEAQRHTSHMHHIARSRALPGDLIFYFAGGPAYHVAIYAGHGKEYSATDPAEGITYQRVWSHNVEYRTDWH